MKITAYRICRSEHVATIWTGVGARDYGGRWNSKGVAVVYASQSRALAAMEQLVHLIQPRVLDGFVVASIAFEEGQVQVIDRVSLPAGWRHPVAPAALRVLGDDWATTARYAVLAVPSAVVEGGVGLPHQLCARGLFRHAQVGSGNVCVRRQTEIADWPSDIHLCERCENAADPAESAANEQEAP